MDVPIGPWQRRFPFGAELVGNGAHFRVWADRRERVEVVLTPASVGETTSVVNLSAEGNGCFSGFVEGAGAGDCYRFRLDGGDAFPDPASRCQPEGPHGPSQLVDPTAFPWTDANWPGPDLLGTVLYELHVGTFTPEGTWLAACEKLSLLADVGVTCIEMMPIAEFPGRFGWGYDGVDWYAPYHHYGTPDDLRHFVNHAHDQGLAVILDAVYNHFGPDGCYVAQFSNAWFTDKYGNDWGRSLDFETTPHVRDFVMANACYWVEEFHFDGLRLDATQDVRDASPRHVCAALTQAARQAVQPRKLLFIAENEAQDPAILRPESKGGWGLDAAWNDDYHHSAVVALTGRREAYFTDYAGTPQELISACRYGYLYQGQWYSWQAQPRGRPGRDVPPARFVHFLENHDQIANLGRGWRTCRLTDPALHRALTALTLLGPQMPMLFQGQEFAAHAPFHYFADHGPELAALVETGRRKFLSQFPRLATPGMQAILPLPHQDDTFRQCQLAWQDRQEHSEILDLHRDLLRLRREDPAFAAQLRVEGAVLGNHAFVLRFSPPEPPEHGEHDEWEERLLLVNLGADLPLAIAPEPLLAPPQGCSWQALWSSDDVRYGGGGTVEPDTGAGWRLSARTAVVLGPVAASDRVLKPDRPAR